MALLVLARTIVPDLLRLGIWERQILKKKATEKKGKVT